MHIVSPELGPSTIHKNAPIPLGSSRQRFARSGPPLRFLRLRIERCPPEIFRDLIILAEARRAQRGRGRGFTAPFTAQPRSAASGGRGCLLSACAGSPRGGAEDLPAALSRKRRRRLRHHAGSAKPTAGRRGRQSGRQPTGRDRHHSTEADGRGARYRWSYGIEEYTPGLADKIADILGIELKRRSYERTATLAIRTG